VIKTLVQIAGLSFVTVSPWAETALQKSNPSYEFVDQSPVLFSVLFQRFSKIDSFDKSCEAAIQALSGSLPINALPESATTETSNWSPAWGAWLPWTEEEKELVTECESQPCKIKLGGGEVEELQRKPASERLDQYAEILRARIRNYLATRERRPYEYVGGIRDPWAEWIERKWLNEGDFSAAPVLTLRKLDFLSNQARHIRQIIDARKTQSARTFLFFNRDLYTDHYFDSWGEGVKLVCRPSQGDITIETIQWVEFDLLKSTDFLSRISRPKMRQTIQEQQRKQLDQWIALVKKSIQ